MYGWRGRVGVIVSPPNTVVEGEFAQMAPRGVSVHVSRLDRPPQAAGPLSRDAVLETNRDLPRATGGLSELRLDVVAFAHTAGSMMGGVKYDVDLAAMMEEKLGCPAVTTTSAVVEALKTLNSQRLALLTPYPQEMTHREVEYLEAAVPGLEVVSQRSMGIESGLAIGDMGPNVAYREARQIDASQADTLFLSGTNWRTIELIPAMEADLKMPVITANQVTMWSILKKLGIDARPGFGSLFGQG